MSAAMDQALYDYLDEERAAGRVVSNKDLAAKAAQLAPLHGVPETFRASSMYIKRWKKRYNVDIDEEQTRPNISLMITW